MDIGDKSPKGISQGRKENAAESSANPDEDLDPSPSQIGYQLSVVKCLVLYPIAILPVCIGLLLAYWFRARWIKLTCRECPLVNASYVLVKDIDGKERVEVVRQVVVEKSKNVAGSERDRLLESLREKAVVKYIEHRCMRYFYDDVEKKYLLLRGYDIGATCTAMHSMALGLKHGDHRERLCLYGPNSINVPVKSYHVLFVEEVLHPFYMFQLLSISLWMYEHYYSYAVCILVLSTISVASSLLQTRKNMQQLHDMASHSSQVTVCRDNKDPMDVPSESLVPGDILVIPPTGMTMPCDAVLLTGTVIVNEASLTGESCPVTKTALPAGTEAVFVPAKFKHYTLFGGTNVIQTRFYSDSHVLALVITTAFATARGRMVRSILYPKPLDLKFYADSLKFLGGLGVIAICGFIYTCALQASTLGPLKTIIRGLDIVTTVVPPALPAALTVGTVYALQRLKKHKIYCISPQRVNLCGKVKLVCFDKTGTLTEDSMNVLGVMDVSDKRFYPLAEDPSQLCHGPLLFAMATCHSLTIINNELVGDPLDVKMFCSTGWTLEEPGADDTTKFDLMAPTVVKSPELGGQGKVELGIIKQFLFSSEMQCMSVLAKHIPSPDPRLVLVYTKGAPEKIVSMCRPDTVPDNFHETLGMLTQKGLRVIAVGHRTMQLSWHKSERIERDAVERDLTFGGLIAMENTLKPETTPVISTLMNANIRTVMITGDNLLTGVSVARGCGMIAPEEQAVVMKVETTGSSSSTSSEDLVDTPLPPPPSHTVHYRLLDGVGVEETSVKKHTKVEMVSRGYQRLALTLELKYHIAIEGSSFLLVKNHFPDLYNKLLVKGTVFARMSPDQKAQLVTDLQSLGYGVCMCGDGANDCGALKAAHAGISLSEAEASVASPFTSKVPNITCVPHLLAEGRAALTTSFSVFKYMALYSLILFASVSMLYWHFTFLGDQQYLYGDLIIILFLSFAMGLTGPYSQLAKRRPPGSLAGVNVLVSMAIHIILAVLFQVFALLYLHGRTWYTPALVINKAETEETTVIFLFLIFQYVSLSVTLSTGPPYRKPLYTNVIFVLCLLVILPCNIYLALAPADWAPGLWKLMQMKPFSYLLFRVGILELIILYFILTYVLESYVFHSMWWHAALRVVRCKKKPFNKYKHILATMDMDPLWPPVEKRELLAGVWPQVEKKGTIQ